MGQIVIYEGKTTDDYQNSVTFPPTAARQAGMQHAGDKIKEYLLDDGGGNPRPFRKAILDVLDDLADAGSGYEVRYEFEQGGTKRSHQIRKLAGRRYVYQLVRASNNKDKGRLVLNIERDEKVTNVHNMHVTAPRRSDEATVFEYLGQVADDIEAIRDTDYAANKSKIQEYLQGAVTFQRCL